VADGIFFQASSRIGRTAVQCNGFPCKPVFVSPPAAHACRAALFCSFSPCPPSPLGLAPLSPGARRAEWKTFCDRYPAGSFSAPAKFVRHLFSPLLPLRGSPGLCLSLGRRVSSSPRPNLSPLARAGLLSASGRFPGLASRFYYVLPTCRL